MFYIQSVRFSLYVWATLKLFSSSLMLLALVQVSIRHTSAKLTASCCQHSSHETFSWIPNAAAPQIWAILIWIQRLRFPPVVHGFLKIFLAFQAPMLKRLHASNFWKLALVLLHPFVKPFFTIVNITVCRSVAMITFVEYVHIRSPLLRNYCFYLQRIYFRYFLLVQKCYRTDYKTIKS